MLLTELAINYGRKEFYKKRTNLNVKIGNGLFYINSGSVKLLYEQTQNQRIAVDIYKKGEFFGYADDDCLKSKCEFKAVFLEDTELIFLDNETIHSLTLIDCHLRVHFTKTMANLIRDSSMRIFILLMLKKSDIILHTLYHLTIKFGRVVKNGKTLVSIKLSDNDIKELCNTTRENVNRTLVKLKNDGLLERKDGHLIISSKEELNNLLLENILT